MINIFSYILDTLIPRYCYSCNSVLISEEKIMCLDCYSEIELKISYFASKNHLAEKYSINNTEHELALFSYSRGEPISMLIPKFKYNENIILGKFIINLFENELNKIEWFKEIDYIIPLPLHWLKKTKRGFNQSEIISDLLGEKLGIPVKKNIMIRYKYTKSQAKTPYKKKKEKFQTKESNSFKVIRPKALENKHILIVDDIITTGYTINNCINSTLGIKNLKISLFFFAATKERLDSDSLIPANSINEPKNNKEIIP